MPATTTPAADLDDTIYPDSDGQPMADNSWQFDWISLLKWNLDALVPDFVAGDHLVYPVRGDATTRIAPDAYVAFGRPKGSRPSYRVWQEADVFPKVVFEVTSPSNTAAEMADKRAFYDRFGADEFYVLSPDFPMYLEVWVRPPGGQLERVPAADGFVSPRLGVRFALKAGELRVFGPDGGEWVTPDHDIRGHKQEKARRAAAEGERDAAAARAEKLAAKLRALGLDPDAD